MVTLLKSSVVFYYEIPMFLFSSWSQEFNFDFNKIPIYYGCYSGVSNESGVFGVTKGTKQDKTKKKNLF